MLWKIQYRYVKRRANFFLAVSEFTKREMVEILKISPAKIFVLPCGCSLEMRHVENEEQSTYLRKKYNLPKEFRLMMKVALELQPCCGNKSGIGIYTYELAKRLHNDNEFSYQGNVFNFRGCTSSMDTFDGVDIFIAENQLMPYGVYRRVWNIIPLSYKRLFPVADINHFLIISFRRGLTEK